RRLNVLGAMHGVLKIAPRFAPGRGRGALQAQRLVAVRHRDRAPLDAVGEDAERHPLFLRQPPVALRLATASLAILVSKNELDDPGGDLYPGDLESDAAQPELHF